jgi:hypothetical protein
MEFRYAAVQLRYDTVEFRYANVSFRYATVQLRYAASSRRRPPVAARGFYRACLLPSRVCNDPIKSAVLSADAREYADLSRTHVQY